MYVHLWMVTFEIKTSRIYLSFFPISSSLENVVTFHGRCICLHSIEYI